MIYRPFLTALILIFGGVSVPRTAAAALSCTASVTDITFGSITVRDGNADQTTGNAVFSCSGGTPNASMTACLSFGAGSGGAGSGNSPRYMRRNDNETLNYDLRTGSHSGATWNNETFTQALDANGIANFSVTIYAVVSSTGPLVRGGSYSSIFTGSNAAFSYGEGSCGSTGLSASFILSATVSPSCTISVTPLAFGSVENLNNAIDQNATIDVTCTNATSYSVKLSLGAGAGVSDPTARKMTLESDTMTYGLYQNNARTTPWGDTLSNDLDGTGLGSSQPLTVYGRIFGSQPIPPVGTYTDTVVVTIEY